MRRNCWNTKCTCRNHRMEPVVREGFRYLYKLTCHVCKTAWWEGLRDDYVQVASVEEPKAAEKQPGVSSRHELVPQTTYSEDTGGGAGLAGAVGRIESAVAQLSAEGAQAPRREEQEDASAE